MPTVTLTARQADTLADMVGVNIHSAYGASDRADPTNAYARNWTPLVSWLGVRHVRDQPATGDTPSGVKSAAAHAKLNAAGISALWVISGPTPLSALTASSLPAPEAVEPYNEWDLFNAAGAWFDDLESFQPSFYSTAKATWPSCTALAPSLAHLASYAETSSLAPNADAANAHLYGRPAQTPEYCPVFTASALPSYETMAPGKPLWVTETGHLSGPMGDPLVEVSDSSAGVLAVRGVLYGAATTANAVINSNPYPVGAGGLGAARWYLYELLDQHAGQFYGFGDAERYGLFRSDLRPKPAAWAIRNLLRLYGDPGAGFTPGSLDITWSGPNAANLNYSLHRKRDGTWLLAFWRPNNITTHPSGTAPSGPIGGTDLAADTSTSVTWTFPTTFAATSLHRPILSSVPVATTGATNTVTAVLRDSVQILALHPTGAPPSYQPVTATRAFHDSRPWSRG